jgi:hypothetical protein
MQLDGNRANDGLTGVSFCDARDGAPCDEIPELVHGVLPALVRHRLPRELGGVARRLVAILVHRVLSALTRHRRPARLAMPIHSEPGKGTPCASFYRGCLHTAQCINLLKATGRRICLLLNCAMPRRKTPANGHLTFTRQGPSVCIGGSIVFAGGSKQEHETTDAHI